MTSEQREILRYVGIMGHPIAVLEKVDGAWRISGECNDIETARTWVGDRPYEIFKRTAKGYKSVECSA